MAASSAAQAPTWAAEDLHATVATLIDTQRSLGDALERLHASLLGGTPQEIDVATRDTTDSLSRGSLPLKRFTQLLTEAGTASPRPVSFVSLIDTLPLQQRSRFIEVTERLAEELYRVGTLRLSIASLVTDLSEHNGRMLSTLRVLASFGPLYDRRSAVLPAPAGRRMVEASA
jgi:hypothetical protein